MIIFAKIFTNIIVIFFESNFRENVKNTRKLNFSSFNPDGKPVRNIAYIL